MGISANNLQNLQNLQKLDLFMQAFGKVDKADNQITDGSIFKNPLQNRDDLFNKIFQLDLEDDGQLGNIFDQEKVANTQIVKNYLAAITEQDPTKAQQAKDNFFAELYNADAMDNEDNAIDGSIFGKEAQEKLNSSMSSGITKNDFFNILKKYDLEDEGIQNGSILNNLAILNYCHYLANNGQTNNWILEYAEKWQNANNTETKENTNEHPQPKEEPIKPAVSSDDINNYSQLFDSGFNPKESWYAYKPDDPTIPATENTENYTKIIEDVTGIKTTTNASAQKDKVYLEHEQDIKNFNTNLTSSQQNTLDKFIKHYNTNKSRYEEVSKKTGMPPELIAAIHWRESGGNFNTYLHQGDPLGKPAVHIPNDIPVFYKWEDAAVHALTMKAGTQKKYGITADSKDISAMLSYAERYNGLGYHNKGRVSPYVYSGTDVYKSGKYVADGKYDPNCKDKQLGVLVMIQSLMKET